MMASTTTKTNDNNEEGAPTTATTTTSLVADILSEAIAAADGRTDQNSPSNTYVRKLIARRIPLAAVDASGGPLIRLILVDAATQAYARDLTTLAFIDVRRADAPAILQHATAVAAATNNTTTAARAILKAVRKTNRIERKAAKAARKAVAIAAHLLDRMDNAAAATAATTVIDNNDDEEMASP
jgi:hypothetical protein